MSAFCKRVFGMRAALRAPAEESYIFSRNCHCSMHSQTEEDVEEAQMAPDPCVEKPAKARFLYSLELDLSLLPPDAA